MGGRRGTQSRRILEDCEMVLLKIREERTQKTNNWTSDANGIKLWKPPGNKENSVKLLFFCKYINHSFNIYWKAVKGGLGAWALESGTHGIMSWFCHLLSVRSQISCKHLWTSVLSIIKWRYYGNYLIRWWGLNQIMHRAYLALFWHL